MIRTTVDGVAYALSDAELEDLIRAARRVVGAWDSDGELDYAAMDNAIGGLVDALDQAEAQEPGEPLCPDCDGTGYVFSQGRPEPFDCRTCRGTGRVACRPHVEPLPWDVDPTCVRCGEEALEPRQ